MSPLVTGITSFGVNASSPFVDPVKVEAEEATANALDRLLHFSTPFLGEL
jgi:hypothetical protein